MPEIKKGNNSAKNISGVTIFNLCKMIYGVMERTDRQTLKISEGIGHALHLYQVS